MSARLGIGDGCLTPRVIVKRASFIKNYESMLATREACRAHVYRPDVRAFLDSAAFQLARSRRTLTYDPDAHPVSARFRAATRDPGGDPTADLSTLHHRFETPHDRRAATWRTTRSSDRSFVRPRARRVRGRLRDALASEAILPAVVQPISAKIAPCTPPSRASASNNPATFTPSASTSMVTTTTRRAP